MHVKLTVSPDGFFYDQKQEEVKLLEFKCLYTRMIVRRTVPAQYADQLQTGLLISTSRKPSLSTVVFEFAAATSFTTG